jgi:hypothetical protein
MNLWIRIAAVSSLVFVAWHAEKGPAGPAVSDGAVRAQMRNVTYHFTESASVRIVALAGALVPTTAGRWPVFDDSSSFNIRVDSARILVLPSDLAGVLNAYVFAGRDAPLKDISISVEKGRLKIKGKLHSKGDLPFETIAFLTSNPDGRVRLHTEKVKALHVPVKGLMDLFGIEINDLIRNGKVAGVEAEKDDLLLNLEQVLPPPHIQGPVTDMHVQGGYIVAVIGTPEAKPAAPATSNFMAYKGNRLQFGKLLMNDTDLTIVDLDPNDPLDFFLERYKDQLVPGYSKITPAFGLRVFIKDFDKIQGPKHSSPGR